MSYTHTIILCCLILACCSSFVVIPVRAFTANSLDIIVDKNGDGVATFRFTLEGFIENSIPQSVLEQELKKGLTTSSEPPELRSMDKSSAVLLMKKFADTSDVPTGTEYRTAMMDFKKAEIALQNSAISSAVSADFSPEKITLIFPDSYKRDFSNVDVLPAVFHTVIDPSKTLRPGASPGAAATPATKGSMNVTSSPLNVKVYLDSVNIGEAPADFPEIAAGTHSVEFKKDSFESVRKNVTIIAGKTTSVMVVLKYIPPVPTENTSLSSSLIWLVAIIALIAIAGGGYYFWSEKKKKEWGEEEDSAAEDTKNLAPAGKDIVSNDTAVREPEVRKPETKKPKVKKTAAKEQVVQEPVTKKPKIKKTVVKEPEVEKPETKDTVVKVTILKDIPDKEPGNNDTKDTRE